MHPDVYERMMQVLDRTATPAVSRELAAHLAECESCAGEWDALRLVQQQLAAAPMLAPADGFADRVMGRVAERERSRSFWRSVIGIVGLLLGTVLVAALVLSWTPLGDLFSPAPWANLINLAAWSVGALTTSGIILKAFVVALLNTIGEWPLLVLAVVAFVLAAVWARIVAGPAPFGRPTRVMEVTQ